MDVDGYVDPIKLGWFGTEQHIKHHHCFAPGLNMGEPAPESMASMGQNLWCPMVSQYGDGHPLFDPSLSDSPAPNLAASLRLQETLADRMESNFFFRV